MLKLKYAEEGDSEILNRIEEALCVESKYVALRSIKRDTRLSKETKRVGDG